MRPVRVENASLYLAARGGCRVHELIKCENGTLIFAVDVLADALP